MDCQDLHKRKPCASNGLTAKCVQCGAIIQGEQPVFRVMRVSSAYHEKDMVLRSPCCSMECAQSARADNVASLKARYLRSLKLIEENDIEEMSLSDFFPKHDKAEK